MPLLSTDNKNNLFSYCMKNVIFWSAEGETVDCMLLKSLHTKTYVLFTKKLFTTLYC